MTPASSRGIALISVLWISILLAVIAASLLSTGRTEVQLADNDLENAKAEALADGAVHRAVLGLLDLDPETAWRPGRTVYRFALGEGEVQIRIEDEDGKVDLNAAPLELIAGLLRAVGLEDDQAETMAARIGDFRDPDDDPEPLGAEDSAYHELGLEAGAADRPFTTESELLRVLGMTEDLYERVRPYVTVYSGAEGVDPTRAPLPVLEALPGMTPALIDRLLAADPEFDLYLAIEDEQAEAELEQYLVPTRDGVFTIRAVARTSGGGVFVREAVIELVADPAQPFLTYVWRRGPRPADPRSRRRGSKGPKRRRFPSQPTVSTSRR